MYCKGLALYAYDVSFEFLFILNACLGLVEGRFFRIEAIETFIEVWGIPKYDFGARHNEGVSEIYIFCSLLYVRSVNRGDYLLARKGVR